MKSPGSLVVFPAYADNPFLTMLLSSAREAGWRMQWPVSLADFITVARELGSGDALHLNWTSEVTQRPRTSVGAARNIRRFLRALDGARARGARMVWTIHNAIAHDARNATQDRQLQQELAKRADAIHIMNRGTALLVDFALPAERVHYLPHPSYLGVYGTAPATSDARAALGIDDDALAVLLLGHMKPYKGALDLLAAAGTVSRPLNLMLAGRGDWRAIDRTRGSLRVVEYRDYVPDAELPTWFAAADVAVLPYRRILNSGSAMLAATFGVPVVMPDEGSVVAEYGRQPWVVTYDRDQPVDGIRSVLDDTTVDWASRGREAIAFAEKVRPERISKSFLKLLVDSTV